MGFPIIRGRRLRTTAGLRRLARETLLSVEDFVLPLFVCPGKNVRTPIESMPGIARMSADVCVKQASEASSLGIPAVILFGIPPRKDPLGTQAYDPDGVVPQAIRAIRKKAPDLIVIADVCLCEYTDHGHCGVIKGDKVDNDQTLDLLAKAAVCYANSGAHVVAPSDMMDGRVLSVRKALDREGLTDTAILSYAVKYASAFYGPFRDAAGSAPSFGDRKSYQMDPANRREALKEADLDVEEGADMIMVKPALAYLDVLSSIRERVTVPVGAYNVSGEYSMIRAAAERGWIDYDLASMEALISIKRAGADFIITYFALEIARKGVD